MLSCSSHNSCYIMLDDRRKQPYNICAVALNGRQDFKSPILGRLFDSHHPDIRDIMLWSFVRFEPEPLRRAYRLLTRVRDVVSANIRALTMPCCETFQFREIVTGQCVSPLGSRVPLPAMTAMSLDVMLSIAKYLAFPPDVLVNRTLSHLSFWPSPNFPLTAMKQVRQEAIVTHKSEEDDGEEKPLDE